MQRKIDLGTAFLNMCGYRADGTPKDQKKGKSVHTIRTGIGGSPRKFGQRFVPTGR